MDFIDFEFLYSCSKSDVHRKNTINSICDRNNGSGKCAADMNGDGLDDITRVSKEGIFIDFQQIDCSFSSHFSLGN